MANKNTPAHDFAPAWLKIPSYEIYKPSGADSERGGHTSRRDEHCYNFTRHGKESDPVTPHYQQQHFSDLRRERDDFDDSHLAKNAHNCSNDNSFVGSSVNSQSALLRRPHSRHDFRNIPASYSKVEANSSRCVNNSSGGYFGSKSKGKLHDGCSNSNNCGGDGRGIGVTSNNFNQEFPSLQGDISEEPTTPPPTLNGGVWEKPRNMKVHSGVIGKKIQLTKKPIRLDASSENNRKSPLGSLQSSVALSSSVVPASGLSNSHTVIVTPIAKGGSSVYRALVPAKNTLIKKSIKEGLKIINKKSSTTPPPSAHSMEILVKHPKAPGNKSEFLKALRNENKGLEEEEDGKDVNGEKNTCTGRKDGTAAGNESRQPHMNGIDINKLTVSGQEEKPLLSSSLEAEERLLREMGWKEDCSDDDNYAPITEDEVREFRDLTEKYPLKNGLRRNLQVNFSPRRMAPFANSVPPPATENISSSSESDSDY